MDMGHPDHHVWIGCSIQKKDNDVKYVEVRVGYIDSSKVHYPDIGVTGNVPLYTRVLHYSMRLCLRKCCKVKRFSYLLTKQRTYGAV